MVVIIYSVSLYHLFVINELLTSEEDRMPGIMATKFCKLIILFFFNQVYLNMWRIGEPEAVLNV